MSKSLLLIFLPSILIACVSSNVVTHDMMYPVSNKGGNHAYYPLTTNMESKAQVKPHEINNYITWQHAIDLVLDGQVKTVAQAHSLTVSLLLKNGATVGTIEPSIDDIFLVINKCGEPCKNIAQITE